MMPIAGCQVDKDRIPLTDNAIIERVRARSAEMLTAIEGPCG